MAGKTVTQQADATDEAWALVPDSCRDLADPQRDLPRIARDQALMEAEKVSEQKRCQEEF